MFWATDLTYGSRTYGVECVRQVLVNECAQNTLQHKLRQPCDRVGLSYSTSRFSMKSSKDTPFGLQGVKPNPFSKESQSQRDSKQIVQPWPVSHYFLKWWPCKKRELSHISVFKLWKWLGFLFFFSRMGTGVLMRSCEFWRDYKHMKPVFQWCGMTFKAWCHFRPAL